MATDIIIEAPWTEDQVAALNAFQHSGLYCPFTCGAVHELHQTLVAERDGWHCPDQDCSYTQNWALAFMADRELVARTQATVQMLQVHARQAPMSVELERVRAELRITEDQLANERAQNASLTQENRALRITLRNANAAKQMHGQGLVPELMAGECDAVWISGVTGGRVVEDVATGDAL